MSDHANFLKGLIERSRSFSGKLVPFVFYRADPGGLEEVLGTHVSVRSSDKAGLVAALSSSVPTIVEGLDVTPSDLVEDVVRLLQSSADVVCRVSDPEACDGRKEDGRYVEPCSRTVHPRILSAVVPIDISGSSVSMSWMAGGEDVLSSEKWAAIDLLADMVPRKPVTAYTSHDVFDRCRASVKTYWGTKNGLSDLLFSLMDKMGAAAAADIERAATPVEVAKRAAIKEVKRWLLSSLGLDGIGPERLQDIVRENEHCLNALRGVADYFHLVTAYEGVPDGVPSPEGAKARMSPLIQAAQDELRAAQEKAPVHR